MCGIVGEYSVSRPTITTEVLKCLMHRGPDDYGHYREKDLFLGHTRLAIQDLSDAGHQPLKSNDDRVVIVYNGEIYNTKELRDDLKGSGLVFRGHSDTEVVLNLYLKYGETFFEKLNGIFSLAIWDQKRRELFLGRDHLGIKPLYYVNINGHFKFASEIKALLAGPMVQPMINARAVSHHLTYLWSPFPDTMIEGVKKLEPGHAMSVKEGKIIKKWKFYDIPYSSLVSNISEKDAIERTRHLVSQAVRRQLISDVPVGAFLSGGLDSSAVVAFAQKHLPDQKIQTFSIDLQGKGLQSEGTTDDLPYARKVAEHLGVPINIVTVGPEIINDLERMIYHLDEPIGDPAPLNVLYISKLAREHGIKVLLSGAGGDDIFSGYRRHFALMQEKYWAWLPKSFRKMLSVTMRYLPQTNHTARRLSKALMYAPVEEENRLVSYFYWLNPDLIHEVLSSSMTEQLLEYDVANPLLSSLRQLPKGVPSLNRMLYLEAKHFLTDHNLNYTDKMGMAEGVEIRVPLLDTDLIAFVSTLPVNFKQKQAIGKWIFKKSMEGILPNEVIYRPKSGFGAPLRYWLKNELKEMVDDILSSQRLKERGLFNPIGVQKLRKLDEMGKVDSSYPIFSIICMELWCRIFIDRSTSFFK